MKNSVAGAYTCRMGYDDNEYDDDEENPDPNSSQNGYFDSYDDSKRHPKKRKLESFVSKNDFVPPRREVWNEEGIFVLLEIWGERYMELGRKSLRADDWADVAEKVSDMTRVKRTEAQCRNQLDMLKNKYKKERVKVEHGQESKWVFFKNLDMLLGVRSRVHSGLGCGIDSGEYVFMNPQVYLDRSNVLDEMRDSPGLSDEEDDDDNDALGADNEDEEEHGESARLLAESIQRFGEIYEKIEENKRNQMMELEKMRQDFQRELEMQKKQIVDRAQAEIAKIREMDDDEDTDSSSETLGD